MKIKNACLCLALLTLSNSYAKSLYERTAYVKPQEKVVKEINAKSKTGFMIGIDNSYTLHQYDIYRSLNVSIGVFMGYNVYFNDNFGLRLFGSYSNFIEDLGMSSRQTNYVDTNRFGFGVDLLYDFFNNKELGLTLGIFGGINFGYDLQAYDIENVHNAFKRNGFYSSTSLGFNIIFKSKNRIDISYRYAFINSTFTDNTIKVTGSAVSPFALSIAYSFIF